MAKRGPQTFDPSSWGAPGPELLRRAPKGAKAKARTGREAARSLLTSAFLTLGVYLLICLPLALGLVGPNGAYGFRTAAAFRSEEAWYAINTAAGWSGLIASLLGIGACAAIAHSGVGAPAQRGAAALVVAVLAILLSLALPLSMTP